MTYDPPEDLIETTRLYLSDDAAPDEFDLTEFSESVAAKLKSWRLDEYAELGPAPTHVKMETTELIPELDEKDGYRAIIHVTKAPDDWDPDHLHEWAGKAARDLAVDAATE